MENKEPAKGNSEKPFVFQIDFNELETALISKQTNFEKIEYLNWYIGFNGIDKGVKYYSEHHNHSEPIPDLWRGIMEARAGMSGWLSKDLANKVYLEGVQAWKDYCQILEIKTNLEQGKPYSIRLDQSQKNEQKLFAKHHVLTYLIECNSKGEKYPTNIKKELERIGQQRMKGTSGNTFYKAFGRIHHKNIDSIKTLSEIGGDNWREIVLSLTNDREKVEAYLQSKGL
jgi:hypothetical protein